MVLFSFWWHGSQIVVEQLQVLSHFGFCDLIILAKLAIIPVSESFQADSIDFVTAHRTAQYKERAAWITPAITVLKGDGDADAVLRRSSGT